ncbi:hypothetical protein [Rhizobacter sp. SG703]|uniref:hypothetical protein n=1 Tax=Rhizobacter sp. SG703 TaxID=2587140 RepID=UPI0017E52789|nr:hypothetical protein [Rhizobacter sp. SG703]NKI92479.1 hypothetical protein [Rhizobacter sp. SG703]
MPATAATARPGGTLDRSDELQIAAHIWAKRKQPWLTLPEGVPTWPEAAAPADLAHALAVR